MNRLLVQRPLRMFEEMFGRMDSMVTREQSRLSENDLDFPVDVKNEKGQIVVCADVPGMLRSDLDVTIENSILTITGKRKREEIKEGENYHFCERPCGTFSRSFRISDVDEQSIAASLHDGVLQVILKRSVEAMPQKIDIS